MWSKTTVLALCFLATCASSAKILGIFPLPSKSHHILSSGLMKELAIRGHNVTMISPYPLKNPPETYRDIDISEIKIQKDELMKKMSFDKDVSFWTRAVTGFEFMNLIGHNFMNFDSFKNFMKKGEQFDVVIQMVLMNEVILGISHEVNATSVIDFSVVSSIPFGHYIHMNSAPYSYVPSLFSAYNDEMSFSQRLVNTLVGFMTDTIVPFFNFQYQKWLKNQYFPDSPALSELIKKIDLHLINSHYSTETPRPYLPNIIQIGGYIFNNKQNLTADLKNFLDNSKNGVIYFSLGSNYNGTQMPKKSLNAFIEAFKAVPYDIIWKYEEELDLPAKIMTKRWLPQTAILAHPNLKVFITHCGMGGTTEAIYNGVPMIAIPIFADQDKNAAYVVRSGFGVELNMDEITKDELIDSIDHVTTNKVFLENIKFRSEIYRDQEMNPMDKAVFWVEHVIKHKGAKHLKGKGSQLYWYQYMLLDVLSVIGVTLAVSLFISYKITKKVFCFCFCRNKKVNVIKKKQ